MPLQVSVEPVRLQAEALELHNLLTRWNNRVYLSLIADTQSPRVYFYVFLQGSRADLDKLSEFLPGKWRIVRCRTATSTASTFILDVQLLNKPGSSVLPARR